MAGVASTFDLAARLDAARTRGRLVLGVDLGQRIDPSALVLTEETLPAHVPPQWRIPAGQRVIDGRDLVPASIRQATTFLVRHIERRHGEAYTKVAARVAEIAANTQRIAHPGTPLTIALDETGLGRPVREMVADALHAAGVRCQLSGIVLTAGERMTGDMGDEDVRVSKAVLVSNMAGLLESGRLKLPGESPEAKAVERELIAYQIRVSRSGVDTYEGAKEHDDLVIALGLSCLAAWPRVTEIKGY